MKSLIKKILAEEVRLKLNENQEYLDFLLDKISEKGIDTLSQKEKDDLMRLSRGEEITTQEDEVEEEDIDLNKEFMHFAMEHEMLTVNGKEYHAEIVDEASGEHIRVTGPDVDFICSPFYEGHRGIAIQMSNDQALLLKVDEEPKNKTEMMAFVQKFYETLLPKIIRKVSSLNNYN